MHVIAKLVLILLFLLYPVWIYEAVWPYQVVIAVCLALVFIIFRLGIWLEDNKGGDTITVWDEMD